MRYVFACILAIASGFAALQIATGLIGLPDGLESQLFAAVVGIMFAATYEQVARTAAQARAVPVPVKVRDVRTRR